MSSQAGKRGMVMVIDKYAREMGTLGSLPLELLLMIFDLLTSGRCLDNVSLVSRRFYGIAILVQYRKITFSSESEWSLNILNTHRFVKSRSPARLACHLGLVRDLHFVAPFRVAQFNRCSFRTALWLTSGQSVSRESDNERLHTDFIWDLLDQMGDILTDLKHGALSSFWWHLGTCLPSHVLDQDGYIPKFQCNIQDLSLRTDPHCPHAGLRLGGLRQLMRLRSLRWQQIVTPEELSLVEDCLENNSETLELLDLEFAPEIASTPFLAIIRRLSSLHTLSLGSFRFTEFIDAALTLSNTRLQSLTLRNCPYQLVLLQILSKSRDPIRLHHFEIALDEAHDIDALSEPSGCALSTFLESFDSLERLHILVSNPRKMERYFEMLKYHPSLKSFVYHTRSYVMDPRRSESTLQVPVYLLADLGTALSRGCLRNIGLCLSPITAKVVLETFLREAGIEVLHLRLSGSEYQLYNMRQALLLELNGEHSDYYFSDSLSFPGSGRYGASPDLFEVQVNAMAVSHFIRLADWVFGPDGIDTLEVLAYGDFSCGDRHKRQQVILVREDPDTLALQANSTRRPYRVALQDLSEANLGAHDTISACPLETMMNNSDWFP